MSNHPFRLANALDQILDRSPSGWRSASTPLMTLVLGSGLGRLAEKIKSPSAVLFGSVPGLARSTAVGHRGEFLIGWLGGVRVIAMAGRLHAYEGHCLETLTRPMAVMAELQPQAVLVSCAAGALNPRFQTGDLVVIDEHLSLLHGSPGAFPGDLTQGASPLRFGEVRAQTCHEPFAEIALQTGGQAGFRVHRGTYLATTGPNYETRAECRMMRGWGMDLVGMSTVPEVVLAAHAGLPTLAIGVVTNMAVPDAPATASHEDVIAVSNLAGSKLEEIVLAIGRSIESEAKGRLQ